MPEELSCPNLESSVFHPETRYACVEFYESSNGEFAGQLHASLPSEEVHQVEQGLNREEYVPAFALEGGQREELPSFVAPGCFGEELKGMAITPAKNLLHPDEQLTPARGPGVQHGLDDELSVESKSILYSKDLFQEQVTGQSIENPEEYVPSLLHLDADSILGLPAPSVQSEWHPTFLQQNHSLMGTASSNFLQGLRPSIEALDNCQGVVRSVPIAPMLHFQSASASRRNASFRSLHESPISEHLAVQRHNGFQLAEHLGVQRHGSILKDLAMRSHLIRLHRKRYAMPQFMTDAGNAIGSGQFAGNQSVSLCSRGVGSHKSSPSETCLYENLLLRAQIQVLRGTGPTCMERKRKQEQLRKRLAKSQAEELLQLHNTKNKAAFQADKFERKRLQQLAPCTFMDDSSSDSDWEVDDENQSGWGKNPDPWQDIEQNTWNQLELQSKKKPLTSEAKKIPDSEDIQHKLSTSFHKFLCRGDASSGESDPELSGCEGSDGDSDSAARATERHTRESNRERETCDFFIREFQEKLELGKLYEEQRNCGSLVCIVCVASGRRWKKFPDLVSLVQHAKSITKTKTRAEHRGYGRAVCEFLGWSTIGRPLSSTRGCIPPTDEDDTN